MFPPTKDELLCLEPVVLKEDFPPPSKKAALYKSQGSWSLRGVVDYYQVHLIGKVFQSCWVQKQTSGHSKEGTLVSIFSSFPLLCLASGGLQSILSTVAYEAQQFSPKQLSVCNKVYHITCLLQVYDISDDGTEDFNIPAECFSSHFQISSNSKYLIILLTSNEKKTANWNRCRWVFRHNFQPDPWDNCLLTIGGCSWQ